MEVTLGISFVAVPLVLALQLLGFISLDAKLCLL